MDKIYQSDWHSHLPEAEEEVLAWLSDRVINVRTRSTSAKTQRLIRDQYEMTKLRHVLHCLIYIDQRLSHARLN
jgi:hypothetical protein